MKSLSISNPLLLGLFLLLPMNAWGQGSSGTESVTSQYLREAGDNAALYHGHLENQYNSKLQITHPFWESEEFVAGDICFDGLIYRQVKLRYNVFSQLLGVVAPAGGHTVIPNQDLISFFTFDGLTFVRRDGRFYCQNYLGQRVSMMQYRVKVQAADQLVDMKSVKDLEKRDFFYLVTEGEMHPVSKFKHVTKLFAPYRQQLKDLRKEQKLQFGNYEQQLRSFGTLARYIDALEVAQKGGVKPATLVNAVSVAPLMPVAVPDSLFANAALVPQLPAYWAYQPGSSNNDYEEELAIADGSVTTDLEPIREQHILDEVEVSSFQKKVGASLVGAEKFRPAQLRNIPLALGEADVMKMLQTLPGVKTMGEASSGFNVRGGASDQNLILLNGNTIYNPMHLFGLFSAFNSDVIGETELYKSGIPSEYGGRISSVMNISSRVPEREEWHGSVSVGLLTSKAMLDMPIVKNRVSLLVGGRTTYSDWMLDRIPEDSGYKNGNAGFWDLSGTLTITPNRNHRISLNGYTSKDRFSFTEYDKYSYRNMNGSLDWKGHFGEKLSTQLLAGYDHYDYLSDDTEVPSSAARLSFGIDQYFGKFITNWKLGENHRLQVGVHSQYYDIAPGRYEPLGDDSYIALHELESDRAMENSLFAEDQWKVLPELTLTGGVRYTVFSSQRTGKEKTYQAPEFRLSASYQIGENQSVKMGFNTMHQFIHKVSNTAIMSPTDTWTLSNANIKPQNGYQVAGGYYYQTDNHQYEASAEIYYKRMDNYLTYRSAGRLVMNADLENDVLGTQGKAYGIEFQLRKPFGKLNGWVSYSYSRTLLRQNKELPGTTTINGGDWFAADYDRPHEFKFVGNYKITQRYSFSLNADYSTGHPITIPAGQYYSSEQQRYLPYYTDRNGYRLPDYFRMDASFNIEPSHHLTLLTHHWMSFGVYNLLGRRNAYSVYYQVENYKIQGYQLSIFGAPIPFVSYNIKF